jgi:hypothetical protein
MERPDPIKWQPWPLEHLRTFGDFVEFSPAWDYSPTLPEVVAARDHLQHRTIEDLVRRVDEMAITYEGRMPPSQCALFLRQFPDVEDEDYLYAHWAMHADKQLGPGVCWAGAALAPREYPEVGDEVQYWAVYRLTQHPWAAARNHMEKLAKSSKVRWVSSKARELLDAHILKHHEHHAEFYAHHG